MSLFDSILGQIGQNDGVAGIAAKLGIDPALAEKALSGLAAAHPQPGDTVATAAANTGIAPGTLEQLVQQIGGTGALASITGAIASNPQAASLLGMLDRDGDGNPIDDIMGMASGLFGKK